MIFQITENMDIILQIHTSYTQYWVSNILNKAQEPLQHVRHQHESMGNGEVRMRE